MLSVRTLALLLAVPLALPAPADEVVLKDGRKIVTKGPYKVKGRNAVMTAADGTLVSIPVAEIDLEKTAEGQARATEPAPAEPQPAPQPLTPAEAARVKSARKASVVLNDADVTHPLDSSEGATAAKEAVDGRVEVSSQAAVPKEGGYQVTGSLMNTGETDVLALVLTVEAIGESNNTILSGFASIAKDTLAPGEKTTFSLEMKTDAKASVFRYYPRWKVLARPAAAAGDATAAGDKSAPTPDETPTPVPTPAPPKPTPTPGVKLQPGFPAPAANGPVGQPDAPGGTYFPVPTDADSQPKQPQ